MGWQSCFLTSVTNRNSQKLEQLKVQCLAYNLHVVCITDRDSELYIPEFDIVRLDRNRHGGSVIIYFRSTFICNLLFMGDVNFEFIVVSLRTPVFLLYQVVKSFTHFNQSGNHSIIDLALFHHLFYSIFVTPSSHFLPLITMASLSPSILMLYPEDLPLAHDCCCTVHDS